MCPNRQHILQAVNYVTTRSNLRCGLLDDSKRKRIIVEISADSPLTALEREEFLGYTDDGKEVYLWWREGTDPPTTREERLDSPVFFLYWLMGYFDRERG